MSILAIGHIGPLQVRHEGSALEQASLRILNAPKGRAQVPDQLQSSDGHAVALLELAGPARQGAAVLGAGRRGPDHVKVAWREHGHGLPAAHVGADGGAGLGVKVQAFYLPAQLREGPAHRSTPRTVPAIVASSFSMSGWKASQITAAKAAPQPASCRWQRAHSQKGCGRGGSSLGEVQTNARGGKFLPIKGTPVWRSTEPAAVMWEPSAYKDAAGDRVNVCLEATEEVLAAVGSWETAAAKMAAKQAPAMFGKPLTEAQLQERFQSCLKTSAQGVKFVKLKATLANVRFWDSESKRTEAPESLRGRRILAAAQPRQLWVMNQQCGLLLELRDVKLDDGVEECPL